MKLIYQKFMYAPVLFVALLLCSCEDVIDFPLKDSSKVPVIEAMFDMHTGICEVKVSETQSLKEKTPSPMITGLEISLLYDNKTSKLFKEVQNGVYQSEKIVTAAGKTYTLVIKKLNAQEYRASAVAPELVVPTLESVKKYAENYRNVTLSWKDPANQENFYWPTVSVNKVSQKVLINLTSDIGKNGNDFNASTIFKSKNTDEVNAQLLNLDAVSFKYYEQLLNLSFEDQLPYNPKNNFDKPVAGVFSVVNYKPIKLTIQ